MNENSDNAYMSQCVFSQTVIVCSVSILLIVCSRSLSFFVIALKQFPRQVSDLSESWNTVLTVLLLHLFLNMTSLNLHNKNVCRMHGFEAED